MTREDKYTRDVNCSEKPNGSLISRQDAIDIVDQFSREEMFHYMESLELDVRATQICHSAIEAVGMINEQIEALPSATCKDCIWHECNYNKVEWDAEPKTGEWIEVTNGRGGHECSECHSYAPSYASGDEHLSDYCPNCGARMTPYKGGESDG